MAKKQIKKETVKPELVYEVYPVGAIEEVEYLVDHRPFVKGDKDKIHPNTAKLLRYNGIVK